MPSHFSMKQRYVREAIAEIQRRLTLPDDAIRCMSIPY